MMASLSSCNLVRRDVRTLMILMIVCLRSLLVPLLRRGIECSPVLRWLLVRRLGFLCLLCYVIIIKILYLYRLDVQSLCYFYYAVVVWTWYCTEYCREMVLFIFGINFIVYIKRLISHFEQILEYVVHILIWHPSR